ncbi:MAG: hypothetical protein JXR85_01080, partial [Deltaproteobacteria bacterium]|nr:hypothetical protein [Deltaproteobacteria bacterium]
VSARLDNTVKQGETAGKGWMTIEGIISPGNGKTLEDSLVEYVLKLQGSSMFSQAKVTKSSPEGLQESEILRFSLTVNFA